MEKTIKNLGAAFIGESQARNRYSIAAKIAKKEGFEQISAIFLETAEQEREHAKWLQRMMAGIDANAKIVVESAEVSLVAKTTVENLEGAIAGEHHEQTSMYPDFAKVADEENLPEVAARLRSIAQSEAHHEARFQALLDSLKAESVFQKTEAVEWVCRKCGFMQKGESAPAKCPSCGHPQSYFQVRCEEF